MSLVLLVGLGLESQDSMLQRVQRLLFADEEKRREEKGQAVVDTITKEGGEAWYHFMDMTSTESVEKLFTDTAEKFGKIDILVNNAANFGLKDGRVDELTQSVALQYGKQNIRCNCVRPGLIVTPQNEAHVPQALKDIFLSNIMVNRYGCPEDIVYLASDESSYVSGQIMNVDGGLNSHVSTVAQFRELNSRTW